MFDSSLVGQRQQRIAKLQQLRDLGIDPYPAKSKKTHELAELVTNFSELEGQQVTAVGRLMRWREHGALRFADLRDASGQVQLYFKEETLSPLDTSAQTLGWSELGLIDVGDFVQAEGELVKTQTGQISISVTNFRILTKTLRPLPDAREGFTDKEERFRRRYVDMVVNPEVRERFERRAKFWQAHRDFFNSRGFHEVNIPILEHIPGGGDAVPFLTRMNALDEDLYLRISHELPLKRLIGAGFEKVYDIGARFRNEGLSDEHLPEHVAMEFYWAYADWEEGMKFIKDLYNYILNTVYPGKKVFKIREFEVDFDKEWEILDFADIMREHFGIADVYTVQLDEVKAKLREHNIAFDEKSVNIPRGVDSLWKKVRKGIAGPAFLINHPKFLSPLQKPSLSNPLMVERFQAIIAGSELGNGWSEVNDPIDQYERFVEQQELRDSGDDEAQWLDIDYVEMLEYGMAPTFGWGHSERVFWFLEDVTAREGVPFPTLKFHVSEATKQLYPEINFSELRSTPTNTQPDADSESVKDVTTESDFTVPGREKAAEFLKQYVSDTYQIHHAEMVETAMRAVAKHYGEDEDLFGITGLIHDWDFDQWPEAHPSRYEQLQAELGVGNSIVDAIKGHADLAYPRRTKLAQALLACDEFCGLLYAYGKMVGNYGSMKISSIAKKMHKELSFAAKINREDILTGIAELGIAEDAFYTLIRDALSAKYD